MLQNVLHDNAFATEHLGNDSENIGKDSNYHQFHYDPKVNQANVHLSSLDQKKWIKPSPIIYGKA